MSAPPPDEGRPPEDGPPTDEHFDGVPPEKLPPQAPLPESSEFPALEPEFHEALREAAGKSPESEPAPPPAGAGEAWPRNRRLRSRPRKPAAKEPPAETPAPEEPVAEEPAAEEPPAQEPPAQEPAARRSPRPRSGRSRRRSLRRSPRANLARRPSTKPGTRPPRLMITRSRPSQRRPASRRRCRIQRRPPIPRRGPRPQRRPRRGPGRRRRLGGHRQALDAESASHRRGRDATAEAQALLVALHPRLVSDRRLLRRRDLAQHPLLPQRHRRRPQPRRQAAEVAQPDSLRARRRTGEHPHPRLRQAGRDSGRPGPVRHDDAAAPRPRPEPDRADVDSPRPQGRHSRLRGEQVQRRIHLRRAEADAHSWSRR